MTRNNSFQKVANCFVILSVVLGSIGWLIGSFATRGKLNWISHEIEFPLGNLNGIAVDSSGNLFCGLRFYSRIHQYNSEGQFVAGWFIEAGGGAFRLHVNNNDELEVATIRNEIYYRFTDGGKLIEKKQGGEKYFNDFGIESETSFLHKDGTAYIISGSELLPKITKTKPSGETLTIANSFTKWLFMGPMPAWLFVMVPIVLRFIITQKKEKTD